MYGTFSRPSRQSIRKILFLSKWNKIILSGMPFFCHCGKSYYHLNWDIQSMWLRWKQADQNFRDHNQWKQASTLGTSYVLGPFLYCCQKEQGWLNDTGKIMSTETNLKFNLMAKYIYIKIGRNYSTDQWEDFFF